MTVLAFTASSSGVMAVFMLWQYVRMKYVLSPHTRAIFEAVRARIDPVLLNSPVGGIWRTVKGYLAPAPAYG